MIDFDYLDDDEPTPTPAPPSLDPAFTTADADALRERAIASAASYVTFHPPANHRGHHPQENHMTPFNATTAESFLTRNAGLYNTTPTHMKKAIRLFPEMLIEFIREMSDPVFSMLTGGIDLTSVKRAIRATPGRPSARAVRAAWNRR